MEFEAASFKMGDEEMGDEAVAANLKVGDEEIEDEAIAAGEVEGECIGNGQRRGKNKLPHSWWTQAEEDLLVDLCMNDLNCTNINGKKYPKWNTIAPHFPTQTRNAVEIRWKQILKGREIDTTFNCPVRAKLPRVVNQTKYLRGSEGHIWWRKLAQEEFPGYEEKYIRNVWRSMKNQEKED